ncbi:MAG: hypothetical protein ACHREM_11550 [Polyangiales bacterium]
MSSPACADSHDQPAHLLRHASMPPAFDSVPLQSLTLEDEASFAHVALYASLKRELVDADYRFRILPPTKVLRWDRALLLNLTFWGASPDQGGDLLVDDRLEADVVTHVAWHHLARRALSSSDAKSSAEELFFGEAIASAFDLYLVGRLLGHAPESSFLATQVPAMADAAEAAGLSPRAFEKVLAGVAKDPERAFEDLRALLFDASVALLACDGAEAAYEVLTSFDGHRFAGLFHHYAMSSWVLYARAYASHALGRDERVRAIDVSLRSAPSSLAWLEREWLTDR